MTLMSKNVCISKTIQLSLYTTDNKIFQSQVADKLEQFAHHLRTHGAAKPVGWMPLDDDCAISWEVKIFTKQEDT